MDDENKIPDDFGKGETVPPTEEELDAHIAEANLKLREAQASLSPEERERIESNSMYARWEADGRGLW